MNKRMSAIITFLVTLSVSIYAASVNKQDENFLFMDCHWKIPKGFSVNKKDSKYYSRLKDGLKHQSITFKDGQFDQSELEAEFVVDVSKLTYGRLSIYSYRYKDTKASDLGFESIDFRVTIFASLGKHIRLVNIDDESIVQDIASQCIPKSSWMKK
ncbi:hypothetical protein FKG94_25440 [Exilibacterium tricleocarpae]|uniref:Uncharacterized protein n=1 Tax=Exilibacterium tricleocarpae TaxID=2591008 RepID=A0A545SRV7_9GAMM|nr:hypothetical protein [Exilibacterium tricleocarpae]TQV67713.1 hypothetical protein FKG94_25440 [Exilibacterium tricleocarpae]